GRITERSFKRYRNFRSLTVPAFHRVTRWRPQSEEYVQRLRLLGVDQARIEVCGNLKYDAIKTGVPDAAERAQARAALRIPADAIVLVGGSTHPTEETTLAFAYKRLHSIEPSLRLILTPRHPERAYEVELA